MATKVQYIFSCHLGPLLTKEYVVLAKHRRTGSSCNTGTGSFRARYFRLSGDNASRRFLVHFHDYIEAVTKEAELRERRELLSVAEYLPLRRENSAVRLCFGLLEFVLGIDLPDEVFADDGFMSLY